MEKSQKSLNELGSDRYCPNLQNVCDLFTLNEKQSIAFKIAGDAMLKYFYEQILEENCIEKKNVSQSDSKNALRMYFGGEGGTGNSRVINTLKYLAKAWGWPDAVQTVATTG